MAISKQTLRNAPIVSLGWVQVSSIGTPVPLSTNIDANNLQAPGTVFSPANSATGLQGTQTELTPTFKGFTIYGLKPGSSNNGMVPNTGQLYLLTAPASGGAGNRTDSGSIVGIIPSNGSLNYPVEGVPGDRFSPYTLYLDGDNNGDGGLVVAYGGSQ